MKCCRGNSTILLMVCLILMGWVLKPLSTQASSKHETLVQIHRDPEPTKRNSKALIFVHGTIGDPKDTWTGSRDVYWPELVTQDQELTDFDVFVFGFLSPVLGDGPSVVDIAKQLNSQLAIKKILPPTPNGRYQKIYFVAHSLGNLIVRQAMQSKSLYENIDVPLIVALAAPNQGADLANVAQHISDNPTLQSMSEFQRNDYLKALNENWLIDHHLTEVACAYETKAFPAPENPGLWRSIADFFTPQVGYIVSQTSAISVCSPTRKPRPFSTDHVWIAKPGERRLEDFRHQWLREQLTMVSNVQKPFTIKLMDSPLVTYDEELKKQGKLNSHQIQDILRDINLDSDPVPIDKKWDSTDSDYIIRQKPDLIVIHFSAFWGLPMQTQDYQGRLAEFINTILTETNSLFLIYSRWREDDLGKMKEYFFENLWAFPNQNRAQERVFFLDIQRITQGGITFDLPNPTFGEQAVKDKLIKKVKTILELKE